MRHVTPKARTVRRRNRGPRDEPATRSGPLSTVGLLSRRERCVYAFRSILWVPAPRWSPTGATGSLEGLPVSALPRSPQGSTSDATVRPRRHGAGAILAPTGDTPSGPYRRHRGHLLVAQPWRNHHYLALSTMCRCHGEGCCASGVTVVLPSYGGTYSPDDVYRSRH
mgnify:CR=1 FL=1